MVSSNAMFKVHNDGTIWDSEIFCQIAIAIRSFPLRISKLAASLLLSAIRMRQSENIFNMTRFQDFIALVKCQYLFAYISYML